MAEYLIQDTTLKAIGDSIRANLTTLEPTASTARIASTYDAGSGQLTDDVQIFYREFIDIQNDYMNELQEPTTDIFVSYDYKPNNDGVITLVIYKTDPNIPSPDLRDQFFYQGRATVNGVVYDKWRKISDNSLPDSQDYGAYDTLYTWESIGKQYWYTNIITEATISPLDMPAKIDEIAAQGGSVTIVDSLTITPSTSRQVFDALDEGAAGYAAVIVDAMPTTSPDISGIDYYGINNTSGDYVVLQMGYTQPTAGYMEAGATTYDYPITTGIPVRDDSDISVSGNTATIPEGYYNNTSITLPETGGGSLETCTVYFYVPPGSDCYYIDKDTATVNTIVVNMNAHISVPKNSIVTMQGWSSAYSASGLCETIFNAFGNAAYFITGNCSFAVEEPA